MIWRLYNIYRNKCNATSIIFNNIIKITINHLEREREREKREILKETYGQMQAWAHNIQDYRQHWPVKDDGHKNGQERERS